MEHIILMVFQTEDRIQFIYIKEQNFHLLHISFPHCPNKIHTHCHKEGKKEMRETKQYLLLPQMVLTLCQPKNPFLSQGLEMLPAHNPTAP